MCKAGQHRKNSVMEVEFEGGAGVGRQTGAGGMRTKILLGNEQGSSGQETG